MAAENIQRKNSLYWLRCALNNGNDSPASFSWPGQARKKIPKAYLNEHNPPQVQHCRMLSSPDPAVSDCRNQTKIKKNPACPAALLTCQCVLLLNDHCKRLLAMWKASAPGTGEAHQVLHQTIKVEGQKMVGRDIMMGLLCHGSGFYGLSPSSF